MVLIYLKRKDYTNGVIYLDRASKFAKNFENNHDG